METINYSTARDHLAETMDRVCNDHAPVIVTRRKSPPVVIMSLDDFHGFEETVYLLKSPGNAKRLLESILQAQQGNIIKKDITE